ncbi:response regulator transcription factor [Pelotalea chapellei]|uniref:Response regulator transcription factor n=1 Tax=Pelotalea chapellei TaxID=44671 RepID=A0ABS5U9P6_9BACT|nr:response regulator transcription factor [Pelotalea chapellei]MBT1072408.1 response regulator transcription factor [Pelotalea chapellei]
MSLKKIIIADDHVIFREGLKQVISSAENMVVTDEASTGQELLQKVQENDYDLVILDISMPGRNGLDTLVELKKVRPKLPVLILSMHPEEQYALRAYKSGASGYMTKGSPVSELLDALRKLALGKKYVSADLAEAMICGLGEPTQIEIQHTLSNREYQVLCMIASGKTVGSIADELALSAKTISTYRSHILRKLNMKNNSEMTRFAIENCLV